MKPKIKYSKKIVFLIIILNVFFTIGNLYVFLRVGSEPTTLTIAWFGFTTGELWMLSGIKKKEVDKEYEQD